jgi:endo-1,4-beta-xylanase
VTLATAKSSVPHGVVMRSLRERHRHTPLLREEGLDAFELYGAQQELGRCEIVPIIEPPAQHAMIRRAIRIATLARSRTEWGVQVRTPTTGPIHAGDVLLASFWVRCVESVTGEGFTTFVLELPHPEWDKTIEMRASAARQWEHYVIPFRAQRSFKAGEALVCFRAGFDRQTIEIAGIELINYGRALNVEDLPKTQITYAGRELDAPWRDEALARIEKIRKADLAVQVNNADGTPLRGASVHVKMLRHSFGFGSAVAAEELLGDAPDNRHYRQTFEKLFNRAVFENDMKWQQTFDGVPERVEQAMQWLEARKIVVRGHCLIWPSWRWLPKALKNYIDNPAYLRQLAAQRCQEMVAKFKGRLCHWDVVNEVYANHDLTDILGKEVLVDWFKIAKEADPDCGLYLNDYGIICGGGTDRTHQDSFYNSIKMLQDHHAPIDGVGIQSHFGMVITPPVQMLRVLDRFSEFGLPIESSEVSLNLNDRELQADFMRDYMTAVFSHPNVHGIMLWGFWEGRHWRPEAALYSSEWKLRPHGQVWIDLVHKQWKTDVTTNLDEGGRAGVRGFCGEYELTITAADGRSKTVRTDLPHLGRQLSVVME